jgi:hypothetical protein
MNTGKEQRSPLPRNVEVLRMEREANGPRRHRSPATDLLLTLDQIAALTRCPRRALQRYRDRMPWPCILGRHSRAHRWSWREVRPWLEVTFGLCLSEAFARSC